jgi:uncharacterized circularly permuted ATP-grasp superfamily protein/uncharacterized alpha-E superfamily protein
MIKMNPGEPIEQSPGADWYANQPGVYDEMWSEEVVHPHWSYFIQSVQRLGFDEIRVRSQEAHRLLRENGVTYTVYGDPQGYNRIWDLDLIPTLINSQEWANIEAGLNERAELLNLILKDIYGPRDLIKHGLLPLELIYCHSGFLRPCDQVQSFNEKQLILYAADMARGNDGQMWILGDRSQAPSGAGYALENRTVISRIVPSLFRDCQVHRLSLFFHALRKSLVSIAPRQVENPRIVVLTPGPFNETYFEHAYLSAYLGFNLVHGDNLVVQDGKVWMKAIGGLQQVDVILRRVDDVFCDPVELRANSYLGVPGLLEAARRGNVIIANPLGSSVLENPGLMAFLPNIAKHFFGHELKIPSVPTWWCGQARERKHVLDNLDNMVIKPINRQFGSQSVFGSKLSEKEKETWRERILAKPHLYVGQKFINLSTTPTLNAGRLEPRHMILRSFLVGRDEGYAVMPGGLTRVSARPGEFIVSNQAGCISKDTWVLASEPEKHFSLWPQVAGSTKALDTSDLPSRVADNLFWVGRYVERTESTARLLRTVLHRSAENDEFDTPANLECLHILLRTLTHLTTTYPGFVGEGAEKILAAPEEQLFNITINYELSGSLANTLRRFQESAYAVRNRWSTDTWRVIDDIDSQLTDLSPTGQGDYLGQIRDRLDDLLTELAAFSGLVMENMTRDYGWYFMDIGRRIERSVLLTGLLNSTCVQHYNEEVENLLLEDLLLTIENLITYRRRYRSSLQRNSVLKLVLLDEDNPRSLAYQLLCLQKYISQLPREQSEHQLSGEERSILEATTQLRLLDIDALSQSIDAGSRYLTLEHFLQNIRQSMFDTSNSITDNFFSHVEGLQPLGIS